MTQIKNRATQEVIFEYEGTIKEAVEEAVRQGISLALADLRCTNLRGANLEGADLSEANFYNANLKDANLRGANLKYANLYNANLSDADLNNANLKIADLSGTIGIPDDLMPLACPTEGSFIAWKTVGCCLIKLEIPEDAKRNSATTKKCRCSKAKVLAITDLDEIESFDEVYNGIYVPLTYKVGEMVYPDWYDEDRWNECSHGIHFFMDKNDALKWVF